MFERRAAVTLHAVNAGAAPGVWVRLIAPPLVSVLARKGAVPALMARTQEAFGFALADAPRCSAGAGMTALGIGPGRWLFLGVTPDTLKPAFADLASLSDHSDGYAVFEVWGPQARQALAKGVAIDLHPDLFTDDVAVTVIAHIGAIVWQSAPERFAIAVFRSYAGSFRHWLSASAAEFGLHVDDKSAEESVKA